MSKKRGIKLIVDYEKWGKAVKVAAQSVVDGLKQIAGTKSPSLPRNDNSNIPIYISDRFAAAAALAADAAVLAAASEVASNLGIDPGSRDESWGGITHTISRGVSPSFETLYTVWHDTDHHEQFGEELRNEDAEVLNVFRASQNTPPNLRQQVAFLSSGTLSDEGGITVSYPHRSYPSTSDLLNSMPDIPGHYAASLGEVLEYANHLADTHPRIAKDNPLHRVYFEAERVLWQKYLMHPRHKWRPGIFPQWAESSFRINSLRLSQTLTVEGGYSSRGLVMGRYHMGFWAPLIAAIKLIYTTMDRRVLRNSAEIRCFWAMYHIIHAFPPIDFRDRPPTFLPWPTVHFDEAGNLHNEDGPALNDEYYLRGIQVPGEAFEETAEIGLRTFQRIMSIRNQEVRRVLIHRVGWERLLESVQHTVIDEDEVPEIGRLIEVIVPAHGIVFGDPLIMRFIRVRNGTPEPDGSFESFLLRVPESIETAWEGGAWTYPGLNISSREEYLRYKRT